MIRAANAYIDRQAPWALRKTDPARMAAVLRVLVGCAAGGRDGAAAVHAGQHGEDAGPARRAGRGADAGGAGDAAAGGDGAAAAQRRVPALRGDGGVGAVMLIDSHCHLDYFRADELPRRAGRAAAAGVGEMVTIGTRLTQSATSLRHRRGASERLVHGRHASAPRRRGADPDAGSARGAGRASAGDRHRRVRAGLFLRQGAARRAAGGFRAHIRAARLAGAAAGHPRPRRRRRYRSDPAR